MPIDEPIGLAKEIFTGLGAVAVAFAFLRQKRSQSDTSEQLEDAKQANSRMEVDRVESLQREIERERQQRQRDGEQSSKREADLRAINDAVRRQFAESLTEFRATLLGRDERIGVLIEEVAELRGKLESMHSQIVDLQAAIQRQKSEDAEARRAMTAGYERQISTLRAENASLVDRNHTLVNQMYGDGTATSIMGPNE